MVSLAFMLFQALARPYRVAWVNDLQLCTSVCLVMLCILELVFSSFQSAAFTPDRDASPEVKALTDQVSVARSAMRMSC